MNAIFEHCKHRGKNTVDAPASFFFSPVHKYSNEHLVVYRSKWENDMLIGIKYKFALY